MLTTHSSKYPWPSELPQGTLSPKLSYWKTQIAKTSGLDPETVETVLKAQRDLGLEPERTPESQKQRSRELETEAMHGGIPNPWERIDVEAYDAEHYHDGMLDQFRYTIMDMEHWNGIDDKRRIFAVTDSPVKAKQLLEQAAEGFQPKPYVDPKKAYDWYEDMDWAIWEQGAGFVGQKHFDGVERNFTTTYTQRLEQDEEETRKPVYFIYDQNRDDINQEYSLGEDPHTPDEVLADLEQVISDYQDTGVARFDGAERLQDAFQQSGSTKEYQAQGYEIYRVPQGLFDDLHEFNDFWGREFDGQEPEAIVTVITPLEVSDREEDRGCALGTPIIAMHSTPEFEAALSPSLREELQLDQHWTFFEKPQSQEVDLQGSIAKGAEQRDQRSEPGPEPTKPTSRENPIAGGRS